VPGGDDTDLLRPVLPGMRALLVAFAGLTLLAVLSLYVGSSATDRFFAWTIDPPLSAAFLGAGYAAGTGLVLLSLRTAVWSHARVPVVTIFVFTLVTLVATVLHLDRFHLQEDQAGLPLAAAWLWIAVYVLVPPAIAVLWWAQERAPGHGPPEHVPLAPWLVALLAAQGTVMTVVAIALFVAPSSAAALWPWPLSPLIARMVAAWLLAFGVAAGLAIRARDLGRMRAAAIAYAVFGVLELVALLRYPDVVAWGSPAAWGYLAVLAAVLVTGGYGWWASTGSRASRLRAASSPSESQGSV
jgi:hypothetical protein